MKGSKKNPNFKPHAAQPSDFIRAKVAADIVSDKYGGRVTTRFPPEPNGYLHIGHAKSICLNFGVAAEHQGGTCNLRFDDTNPATEEVKYSESIQQDVRWLGFDWEGKTRYASDYFEQLYVYAVQLIELSLAYVCDLSEAEVREYRGTVTEPGRQSPHRNRSIEENLDLFQRMRAGEFADGSRVLRAKIDMASPNMIMRDTILYRIRRLHHYRTGDEWYIYPMYDFTHCLSDAIEKITHSLCTLEFKDNREIYDWILRAVAIQNPPEQTEFARLNLDYTVLSKRKLIRLVEERHVSGWDDPRMPTLAGLRRRGVTPTAIRTFCDLIGVARTDSRIDIAKFEYCIRDDLNMIAPRVMGVLHPLRVVIENYPADSQEILVAPSYPHDVPKEGSRDVPFSRILYIERDDFLEDPPPGYFRLAPGREVRLRYAYFITCTDVKKHPDSGDIVEIRCTYDPESRGGRSPDGRKVKGTLHWVSAEHSVPAEVRLYDRLFNVPDPEDIPDGADFLTHVNSHSVVRLTNCRIEPSVLNDPPGIRYQFERLGYFVTDSVDSKADSLVFNRIVPLRDTWAKISGKRGRSDPRVEESMPKKKADKVPKHYLDQPPTSQHESAGVQLNYNGLSQEESRIIGGNTALLAFFEDALTAHDDPAAVAKWVINDVLGEISGGSVDSLPFSGVDLGSLVALVSNKTISRSTAKSVFSAMAVGGGSPSEIIERDGLTETFDAQSIEKAVKSTLATHPDKVNEYKRGRHGLMGFFVGQVMRETGSRADPETVKRLLRDSLS